MRRGAVLALALAAAGCGYSVAAGAGRLPAGAEKVYVATFANRTTDAEAGALVAGALRDELARRGSSGGPGSAARIEGTVTQVAWIPTTPDGGTWRLTLEVQARLVVEGKVASEQVVRREQDYLSEVDALATEGRRRLAVRQASAAAAREIVERFEVP
jgi:hypothetical protein